MAIPPINNRYVTEPVTPLSAVSKTASKTAEKEGDNKTTKTAQDVFVKSTEEDTYKEPKRLTTDQLKEISNQQIGSFQNMLSRMMINQADKANIAYNGMNAINADLFSRITVTPKEQTQAQQAISEDGEWGVNAVATRIMDMAVALSGGDTSKLSVLKGAVEKGFSQAGLQWGQKLPSICQDTYDEIQKRFDYWEANNSLDNYQYAPNPSE